MDSVLAAEILKVRKRWMPYVLLLVMIAGAAVLVWLIGYVGYQEDRQGEYAGDAFRTFAFPWSIAALLDSGQFWGAAVFVAILTSSTVATEYNWGTVRQALTRGQPRWQFLAAKLLGTAIICTIFLLTALGVGILFSILATSAEGESITLDVPGGPSVPEIFLMILRSAVGIIPYGLLAFALAVIGRSTALGIAGTIGYLLGEGIIVAILESIGGVAADFREVTIGHHVASLIAANRIGSGDYNSIAAREIPVSGDLPDVWAATFVILVYCAIFVAMAFLVFNRRDLRSSDR
ncbi:MAG TPA: ABC transporter permease subunit [Dehalococcoidia bacterium]|jgi:ABC-2 type transport system permease protein|nr:ABC transporter permease subunit [Dehalococcoidia bacterium]